MSRNEYLDMLLGLPEEQRLKELDGLSEAQKEEFKTHWRLWARKDQLPPEGDWTIWLILAGRGFGKTRAGAEWVRRMTELDPDARIALVGATLGEARSVMVEGESGILAVSPPGRVPVFEPSLRHLTWPNGAQATLYSAGEPESLRGPQHSHAHRPGPEGAIRQRSAVLCRRPFALRHRGRVSHASRHPGRWHELADRRIRNRRLGGTRWRTGLPASR